MKRARMKKTENPVGLSYFFCGGKTCDRENCLVRCHSLEEARKDFLILDFTANVRRKLLASNSISKNPKIEHLDRCKTLEDAKDDPLVLELIAKLKHEVYVKSGKTVYWEEVLKGNPNVAILLGHALLNELNIPKDYDFRRKILDEHRDVPVLLFYSLLNQIADIPSCDILSGEFEAKKKASAKDIYKKLVLDKRLK